MIITTAFRTMKQFRVCPSERTGGRPADELRSIITTTTNNNNDCNNNNDNDIYIYIYIYIMLTYAGHPVGAQTSLALTSLRR